MSKLDLAKEKIAFLKLWLGIVVLTDISLVGWLISNSGSVPAHKMIGGLMSVCALTLAGYKLHRRIQSSIEALEEL
ncbi:MAG: hypothetical protein H0V62_02960 [Gammaproteobacteria bacterium]|nr:hypothetical protein [Gammaproteobacteria bacterium]